MLIYSKAKITKVAQISLEVAERGRDCLIGVIPLLPTREGVAYMCMGILLGMKERISAQGGDATTIDWSADQ